MKKAQPRKIITSIVVFFLIVQWVFTGWPHLWRLSTPQVAQAITYTDTFSANGTWVAPSLVTDVTVEAWGAGGAGAGEAANTQYGQGGGGGGAYSAGAVTVVGGNSYTVVVGVGLEVPGVAVTVGLAVSGLAVGETVGVALGPACSAAIPRQ